MIITEASKSSIHSPSSALFTAATWFHRFFMRFTLEDYHRQVRSNVVGVALVAASHTSVNRMWPPRASFWQLKQKNAVES
jgi:hypothetical protein